MALNVIREPRTQDIGESVLHYLTLDEPPVTQVEPVVYSSGPSVQCKEVMRWRQTTYRVQCARPLSHVTTVSIAVTVTTNRNIVRGSSLLQASNSLSVARPTIVGSSKWSCLDQLAVAR